MVNSGLKLYGQQKSGYIYFTNIDQSISFSPYPGSTGTKKILLSFLLSGSTSTFALMIKDNSFNDFVYISYTEVTPFEQTILGISGYKLLVQTRNSPSLVRKYYNIDSYIGGVCNLELNKTATAITSVKISGNTLTAIANGLYDLSTGGQDCTIGGLYSSVFDVSIDGQNNWVGYPVGNSNEAWTDTIGNSDGTITGTPSALLPNNPLPILKLEGKGASFSQFIFDPHVLSFNTSGVTLIHTSGATSGGIIISDGGYSITARGVCYATYPYPDLRNSYTSNGTGTGSFTSTLTGLTSSTTYYVRIYITNSTGTYYGDDISFTTDGLSLMDRDGNPYTTVVIGSQEWTVENLRTTSYNKWNDVSTSYIKIPNLSSSTATDWYLPSIGDANLLTTNLVPLGLGNFIDTNYWTSSSAGVGSNAKWTNIYTGSGSDNTKSTLYISRSIRDFTVTNGIINYIYGDIGPAGGWIFNGLDNGDGTSTYYECAPFDNLPAKWSNINTLVTTSSSERTGKANTATIIGQVGHTTSAAKVCDDLSLGGWTSDTKGAYSWYNNDIANKDTYGALYNWHSLIHGYTDWYLPSKDELGEMYTNLKLNTIGGFADAEYWSSTEFSSTNAWEQNFSTGTQYSGFGKEGVYHVRACRSFMGNSGDYNNGDVGPAGGWIFYQYYDDSFNYWYFEAAPSDLANSAWSSIIDTAIGTTLSTINEGKNNTSEILSQHSTGGTSAALLCYNSNAGTPNFVYLERNGIQENGWRVPTDTDWTNLETYIGSSVSHKIREVGITHWATPNAGATNETNFTALPSGFRLTAGNFANITNFAYWWSYTSFNSTYARGRYISELADINNLVELKTDGYSVRLVRDV